MDVRQKNALSHPCGSRGHTGAVVDGGRLSSLSVPSMRVGARAESKTHHRSRGEDFASTRPWDSEESTLQDDPAASLGSRMLGA